MRTLLVLAVTISPAIAQSVTLEVNGTVSSIPVPLPSGPFAGASVGQSARLVVDFQLPGAIVGGSRHYTPVPGTLSLTIGAAMDGPSPGDIAPLVVRDGGGIPEGFVYGFDLATGGMGGILTALSANGDPLPSADLMRVFCTLPGPAFDNPTLLVVAPAGGLEVSIGQIGVQPSALLGNQVCSPAVANSSGSPATLSVSGHENAALNLLALHAANLPANQFALFLNSATPGQVLGPGGSQGVLCLGGAIGRHPIVAPITNAGAVCHRSLVVDLGGMPTPTGPVAVQPGDTLLFQCWYRDVNPNSTSNFTDAVAVTFQ